LLVGRNGRSEVGVSLRFDVELNGVRVPLELSDGALSAIAAALPRDEQSCWPEWMNVETVARYLDVSPERIRKLKARREIPFHQEGPGCRVLFRRAEIDNWMSGARHRTRGGGA
jgi:excisionase family DNA binding protein